MNTTSIFISKHLFVSLIVFSLCLPSIAATRIWNGGGANNNMNNPANWGGTTPVTGDDIVFAGNTRLTPNNDFPVAGLIVNSITFSPGAGAFVLSGNAISVTGGIINANNTSLTMNIGLGLVFSSVAPTINVASGGILTISGAINNGGLLLTSAGAGTTILSGAISGAGALTKSGSGPLTLSGANSFTGGVNLVTGQLNINSTTALGVSAGTFTISNGTTIDNTSAGAITVSTDNPMIWNGDFIYNGTQALDLGIGTVSMGAAVRTITTNASTLTTAGTITGTGGITKNGAGTLSLYRLGLVLNAVNWSGINTINAGTILLGNPSSDNYRALQWNVNTGGTLKYSPNNANVLVNTTIITLNGGTYDQSNQKEAVGYLAGTGNAINIGIAALGNGFEIDLPATGSGSIFSGIISGPGMVNVRGGQGTGKQIFSGLNTYTGQTWVQRGTFSVNTIYNVGAVSSAIGAPTTVANATIQMGVTGNANPDGILEYTGTTQTTDRVLNFVGGGTIDQSGPSGSILTFSSNITATGTGAKTIRLQGSTDGTGVMPVVIPDGSGTTSLTKAGTGTWTISGANTYTGTTTFSGGTLVMGIANTIPAASNVIAAGGTLSTGAGAGLNQTAGTLTLTGNSTIALGTGNHSLHFNASNATTWTAGRLLTITNWQGTYNCTSTGTAGKIFTGSSAELSAAKLAQITFINPGDNIAYRACQLSTGEIVPSNVPLPVVLLFFNGKNIGDVNELYWSTAKETNSSYFDILRSDDGIHFESIGTLRAAGNSSNTRNYTFTDSAPMNGVNYYQLVQYDINGDHANYNIIAISTTGDGTFKLNAVYPVPASASVNLYFQADLNGTYTIHLYDDLGKIVNTFFTEGITGNNQYTIPVNVYSNGTYFARIISPSGKSLVAKIIVQQ